MKNKSSFILLNVVLSLFIVIAGVAIGGIIIKNNIENNVETKSTNVISNVESDIENLYESVVDGVVYIEALSFNEGGSGSGFIYKIDGGYAYILTNYHVVENAKKLTVTTNSGDVVENVKYLGGDAMYDVAVIKAKATDTMIELPLNERSDFGVGEHVLAVGSPLGEEYINTATFGIVSGKERYVVLNEENQWGLNLIQTDTVINPGNSGGPLFAMSGEVIGMNTIKYVSEGIEGMGFAIPMEIVVPKLSALEEGKGVRPVLGISTRDNNGKVEVVDVSQNGAAATAGIRPGDVIVSFNGNAIEDTQTLRKEINKQVVGAEVEIVVNRDGKDMNVSVTLGGSAS